MISLNRLNEELLAAGLPITAVDPNWWNSGTPMTGVSLGNPGVPDPKATVCVRVPEGNIRLDWSVVPTAAQKAQAQAIVSAHDGNPTVEEKMDKAKVAYHRALAAVTLRASTQWATLAPAQKLAVQNQIDAAANKIIDALS